MGNNGPVPLTSYFQRLASRPNEVSGRPVHRKVQCGSLSRPSCCSRSSRESRARLATSARKTGRLKCCARLRNFFTVFCQDEDMNCYFEQKCKVTFYIYLSKILRYLYFVLHLSISSFQYFYSTSRINSATFI